MIVRCPQCGTEFDKDANEFCPNPACGYPSAFILAPEADEEQPDDMTRRPGEQATAPQPVIPTTPPAPPPGPSPSPTLVEPVPVAPAAPPPRRRQPPLIALIGIGFAIGVVIILGAVVGVVWQERGLSLAGVLKKLRPRRSRRQQRDPAS